MSHKDREIKELKQQLQTEDKLMAGILALVQADVDAQAANAASLAAIQQSITDALAHPVVAGNDELKAQLTKIQDDLGDTSSDIAATAASTTATAVAAAAAPAETITAPAPTSGS